jgi:sec-independent protein translocase protein TatA
MMGLDNPIHLAFLLVILLMVFGAKRLPEMGRSLGSGLRGFKESVTGSEPVSEISATPEHTTPAPVHSAPIVRETHVETTAPVA